MGLWEEQSVSLKGLTLGNESPPFKFSEPLYCPPCVISNLWG